MMGTEPMATSPTATYTVIVTLFGGDGRPFMVLSLELRL